MSVEDGFTMTHSFGEFEIGAAGGAAAAGPPAEDERASPPGPRSASHWRRAAPPSSRWPCSAVAWAPCGPLRRRDEGRRRLALPLAAGLAVAGLTLAILALGPGIGGRDATTTARVAAVNPRAGARSSPAWAARAATRSPRRARPASSAPTSISACAPTRRRHSRRRPRSARVRGFSGMPEDFGKRMSDAELDALVSFLLASRAELARAPLGPGDDAGLGARLLVEHREVFELVPSGSRK